MKKPELIKKIHAKLNGELTQNKIENCVDALFDVIVECLVDGDSYNHTKFGTFKTVQRAARSGRNPSTRERLVIGPKRALKLVVSSSLKERIAKTDPLLKDKTEE